MSNNGASDEKRAKLAEEGELSPVATEDDALYQAALEEIDDCQSQIDSLNEQASEEILAVEVRFNTLRKPHYSKRAEIIAKVPRFWITTFMNHPQLSLTIPEEQQHCLQDLQNLLIEEFEDIKNGYKIILKFNPNNPYFENESLIKEYRLEGNGQPKSVVTPIKWKPGKNFLADNADRGSRKRKASDSSFFSWFTDSNHSSLDEIADILKDEIWPNPLQFFMMPEALSEEGDDDGDVEDEEDEEDEEGDVEGDAEGESNYDTD
ncbi:hypothetical protein GHT06_018100 [Daphnia sinensis]|uniref:Protein SET n=1 Tax=Daphnia sinensis TaxID=1820382 RepID=A0AAD5PUD7_9CRUS|nr:hypothetical protein GHT06_018100 [Daphnia sinensis]